MNPENVIGVERSIAEERVEKFTIASTPHKHVAPMV